MLIPKPIRIRFTPSVVITVPDTWLYAETWLVFRYRPPFFYNGKKLLPFISVANDN